MCCTRLAGNTGRKNDAKNRHLRTIDTNLSSYVLATEACIDNWKKLVKQQYLLQMSHNVVNVGPLVAEISAEVSGSPANFNGFRVLAS